MTTKDKKKEKKQKSKKPTIMVVDDEPALVGSLEHLLSKYYNVITALSGLEALKKIKQMKQHKKISLIISDQRMPGMTGVEFLEKVKKKLPTTTRIILTAYDDKDVIIDAINVAGIYQFIVKPFDNEDLKLRVKRGIEAFEYQKALEESRITDSLTKLYNRRYTRETIKKDIARVRRIYEKKHSGKSFTVPKDIYIACLMIDIDNFKSVNDKYGHDAGDKVLKRLAKILKKKTREEDVVVRWGGGRVHGYQSFYR